MPTSQKRKKLSTACPNCHQENRLIKNGFVYVAGVDEAGRGAWAGPIVAGAVILNPKLKIKGVKDSKLLSPKARNELAKRIIDLSLAWSFGVVNQKIIDKIGLGAANVLAMQIALKNLAIKPDYILADGICFKGGKIPFSNVIGGDRKISSIAAASIIAKVKRDEIMKKFSSKYYQYGFAQHKGYGTKLHRQMIEKYNICTLHRKSFKPITDLLK